jgi:VIT1/CCC1 family predicted Fe2+/Mn2+ transporter
VGIGYLAGALVPVLPVVFGSRSMLPTVLAAGIVIVVVSAIVAFLSGMDVRRRIALNVAVTGIAVIVTYGIGLAAKTVLGVTV